jgi:hypothetical protein
LKTIVGDAAFGGKINKTSNNSKIIMSLISGYVNNAIQTQYFVCVCVCVVVLFISYTGVGAVGANQPEKIEIFYTEQRATKTRTTHTQLKPNEQNGRQNQPQENRHPRKTEECHQIGDVDIVSSFG